MTVFAKWDERFSVGSAPLDRQHSNILDRINDLYDALMTQQGEAVARATLEKLKEYVKVHFAAEEALLRKVGYPDLEVQIKQHRYFQQQISELESQCAMGVDFAPSVFAFLRDWFLNHIREMDGEYKDFLPSSDRKE